MPQLSSETEVSIALLFSVSYVQLHSGMDQELFEKHLCNQGSHYEKWTISITQRKSLRATTKSTLFTVSKDEWNTKENTGKSLKNALHVRTAVCQTAPLGLKQS